MIVLPFLAKFFSVRTVWKAEEASRPVVGSVERHVSRESSRVLERTSYRREIEQMGLPEAAPR